MSKKRKKKGSTSSEGAAGAAAGKPAAKNEPRPDARTVTEDVAEDAPRERTAYDSLRENLEALIVAIVLAIVIRHFAVEAFEIPTGSMATTLYGMHARFDCPNCDHEFDCGISSNSSTGELKVRYQSIWVCEQECPDASCALELHAYGPGERSLQRGSKVKCASDGTEFRPEPDSYRKTTALLKPLRCPICHHVWIAVVESENRHGGDKILVNKFVYQIGPAKRFDVIVFGFDQWKNYIKRLTGLPGETIHVIAGDIYVDGEIVRKSRGWPDVQDSLWRQISDSDVGERGLNEASAWTEIDEVGVRTWKRLEDGRWSINTAAGEKPSIFSYESLIPRHDGRDGRGFDNYVAYNALAPYTSQNIVGDFLVGDMKLVFTVEPTSGDGWIGAEIREQNWTFQARIPVGAPSKTAPATLERVLNEKRGDGQSGLKPAFVTSDGRSWKATNAGISLTLNEKSVVEFENCDDRVVVRIDDEEVLDLDFVSVENVDAPPRQVKVAKHGQRQSYDQHYVRLLASDVKANVQSIRLYQDVYYTPLQGFQSIRLEEGQYFAMGDNSPSSSDGRAWGHVPEQNLMGKALLVFWPALPWRAKSSSGFRWKFIR